MVLLASLAVVLEVLHIRLTVVLTSFYGSHHSRTRLVLMLCAAWLVGLGLSSIVEPNIERICVRDQQSKCLISPSGPGWSIRMVLRHKIGFKAAKP